MKKFFHTKKFLLGFVSILVLNSCQKPAKSKSRLRDSTSGSATFGIKIDSEGNIGTINTELRMDFSGSRSGSHSDTTGERITLGGRFESIKDYFENISFESLQGEPNPDRALTREVADSRLERNSFAPSANRQGQVKINVETFRTLAEARATFEQQAAEVRQEIEAKHEATISATQALQALAEASVAMHNQGITTVTLSHAELLAALEQLPLSRYKTLASTLEGQRLRQTAAYLNYAKRQSDSHPGRYIDGTKLSMQEVIHFAEQALITADNFYAQGDIHAGDTSRQIAIALLDLGMSITPGVGLAKDASELLTGKNTITGEPLSTFERSLAAVGVLTCGLSNIATDSAKTIYVVGKILSKSSEQAKSIEALRNASKTVESAKEIGLDNAPQIKQLATTIEKSGVKAKKVTETLEAIGKSDDFARAVKATSINKPMFYVKQTGEAIPSTGYRYVPSNVSYLDELVSTGRIPANPASTSEPFRATYIGFDKYDDAATAASKFQVPHDAAIRVEFDTLQVVDDLKIPNGNWNTADWLEPLTRDQPQFGVGGAAQAITNSEIKASRIVDLKSGRVLYERQ